MTTEATVGALVGSDPSLRSKGSLTRTLWDASSGTYDAILRLPFLTELVSGALTEEQFTYYLTQDSYYMRAYNKSLATVAAAAPDIEISNMLFSHIVGAIGLESGLHAELIEMMGTAPLTSTWPGRAPTCMAYSNYISTTCERGSFLQGIVSVLPCYWIYARVGAQLQELGSPHPAYKKWIESYGDGVFEKVVVEALNCVDEVGADAGRDEWDAALEHYDTCARYEWMFWDAAYRMERWPEVS